MNKRLLLLSGLSIFAVVCNHAAGRGFISMFFWVHRFRPVTPPNYDQIGSLTYYILQAISQLSHFSVPAFIFISGVFITYATRSSQPGATAKVIRSRIITLLIPYVIWSVVVFFLNYVQGIRLTPLQYIQNLIFGEALVAYYYVPLLIQFYILSPLIVAAARKNWKILLLATAVIQLLVFAPRYVYILAGDVYYAETIMKYTPIWLFTNHLIFFVLGIIYGLHTQVFKSAIERYRRPLVIAAGVLAVWAVVEFELLFRLSGRDWLADLATISSYLFAIAFIFVFISSDKPLPFSNALAQLGRYTYGIYLIHPIVLDNLSKVIYHVAPALFAYQIIFLALLIFFGLSVPLALMKLITISPARRSYRYLFG